MLYFKFLFVTLEYIYFAHICVLRAYISIEVLKL